jgi:hypothetical protein
LTTPAKCMLVSPLTEPHDPGTLCWRRSEKFIKGNQHSLALGNLPLPFALSANSHPFAHLSLIHESTLACEIKTILSVAFQLVLQIISKYISALNSLMTQIIAFSD